MGFRYEDEDAEDEDVKKSVPRDQRPKREEREEEPEQHDTSASNNNNKDNEQSKPDLVKEVSRDKEREVNSTSRLYGIEDYARMLRLDNNWQREQFDLKNKVSNNYYFCQRC